MFIFDTNVFITASRTFYGFDIAPGFWEWIKGSGLTDVASSVHTKSEINAGKYPAEEDPLKAWAAGVRSDFWITDTDATVAAMMELQEWAEAPERTYLESAVADFLDSVDFRIIAQAKAQGAILVTHERSEPQRKNKVKIPDACAGVGVVSLDPISAYRSLGLRLNAA